MTERVVDVEGVTLCTESFGEPHDPTVLLIMGIGASMLWWDERFCRMLADNGRFVIRYDHRDTGRSINYQPGHPGYSGADLAADALRVLDGYGIAAAHIVGVSAGAAFAQLAALENPRRVCSLTVISSSPATPGDRGLPSPTDAFFEFVSTAEVDWSNQQSVVDYLVGYTRMLAGAVRPFDEVAARQLVHHDIERTTNAASLQNHGLLTDDDRTYPPLSAIVASTLVIHGTADPMFPPRHAEALAAEIPGARLLLLDGAGHGVEQADWPTLAAAIVEHTRE